MEKSLYGTEIILVVVLLAFSPVNLHSAQIEHHGEMVEAEGSVQDCLSCHDGVMAVAAGLCTVKCVAEISHPILVDYPPRRDRNLYAPAEAVKARGIIIVGGKMTCLSCHNLRNSTKSHLAAEGRELCQICHIGI